MSTDAAAGTRVWGERVARLAAEGAGLLIAAPLWLWWAVWKGGYPAAVFLPGLVYLALAAVVLYVFAPRRRLGGPARLALAALSALTVWTLASLLWAEDKGGAEIAIARQTLLLGSFALPLLWPPSRRALAGAVALVPVVALAGGISALVAVSGDAGLLLDGRLVEPSGYPNATAALMAFGVLPALVLASRRRLPAPLRVAMLTSAGGLLGIFMLTQSRGGVAALLLALVLAVAFTPGRLRLLIPVAIALGALGTVLPTLLEVRTVAVDGGDLQAAFETAVRSLVAMTAGLALLALAYVSLDARLDVPPATTRRASGLLALVASVAVAAAAVAVLALGPAPGDWISERVEDFKTPDYSRLESERSRFTGDLGSNRYDYWRVSLDVFADRPLNGSGAGNFIAPFLERRRADKATIFAHSLWLGSLGQLGIVGLLALLGFLGGLVAALARAARSPATPRWLIVAAALPLAYVLLHASADWIDAFPAVIAPAAALAGAAAGLGAVGPAAERGPRSASLWLVLGLGAAAIAALPLLVSARLADRGAATWPQRPAGAIADLERAAELDPLAAAPYVRLGVVAVELRKPQLERRAFEAALERDPSAWYPEYQLGLLAAAEGRRRRATAHLAVAARRNPREVEVTKALRAVHAGRVPDPRAAQQRILESPES